MSRYIKPSAFHSFDPLRIDPLKLIEPIQASLGGDHHQLKELVKNSSDISALKQGVPPTFDPATILFLSCRQKTRKVIRRLKKRSIKL